MNRNTDCQVYGCNRTEKPGAVINVIIDTDDTETLRVCDTHQAFFEDAVAGTYTIGRTFTGEVEIRLGAPASQTPDPETPEED